jgi:hypothetical protein
MLRSLRANPTTTALFLAALLILPMLLAERLAVPVRYVLPDHSGRELIALRLLYLIPVITGLLSVVIVPDAFARVFRSRVAFIGPACLAIDIVVFFAAGVLERSFRAALAFPIASAASIGALLTGIALYHLVPRAIDYLVATATSVSAVVGGFQMSEAYGFHTPVGVAIVNWDRATAHTFHTHIAWMRAEGFAQNPNMYTPFAIVGFIWALFGTPRPAARWLILGSSLAVALLGGSQTTLSVLAVLVALFVLREAARRMPPKAAQLLVWAAVAIAVIGGLAAVGILASRSAELANGGSATALVATSGVPEDGIESRLVVWGLAVDEARQNPWGTFGRTIDRLKPYSHAHNEVLQRLLYAGPLWPLVYLVFLGWILVWLRPRSMQWIGVAIFLALLLNGTTEPIDRMHPYTVLLYVIIGAAMWQMTSEREPVPVPSDI